MAGRTPSRPRRPPAPTAARGAQRRTRGPQPTGWGCADGRRKRENRPDPDRPAGRAATAGSGPGRAGRIGRAAGRDRGPIGPLMPSGGKSQAVQSRCVRVFNPQSRCVRVFNLTDHVTDSGRENAVHDRPDGVPDLAPALVPRPGNPRVREGCPPGRGGRPAPRLGRRLALPGRSTDPSPMASPAGPGPAPRRPSRSRPRR